MIRAVKNVYSEHFPRRIVHLAAVVFISIFGTLSLYILLHSSCLRCAPPKLAYDVGKTMSYNLVVSGYHHTIIGFYRR